MSIYVNNDYISGSKGPFNIYTIEWGGIKLGGGYTMFTLSYGGGSLVSVTALEVGVKVVVSVYR